MKIQYVLNLLDKKEVINSINYEDACFIREVYNFVNIYNGHKDHLPKFIIQKLFYFLNQQENYVKKRYVQLGKMYLFSITKYVIENIREKIILEYDDLCKDYNLDINHKCISLFSFEKFLSREVNIIAFRGDSRDPSTIFKQGFQSFCDSNTAVFSEKYKNFIDNVFISGKASVALSSDFKVASYFPITENVNSYIYICKVNKAYNTAAEHYKRFVLGAKNVSNEYLMGVRINELNTDFIENKNIYAAFKIQRSLIYQFGTINYYGQNFPVKRSFKIKSIIFNNINRNGIENMEFLNVKNHFDNVYKDLIDKEFIFSIDEIIKK